MDKWTAVNTQSENLDWSGHLWRWVDVMGLWARIWYSEMSVIEMVMVPKMANQN